MRKSVQFYSWDTLLRGSLHIPERDRPVPGVLIVPGFADTAVGAHGMHVQLACALERAGYAVLRFDYGGLGESDGEFREFTVLRGLDDAFRALMTLRRQPDVDEQRIGVVGYSLGGAYAVHLAASMPEPVRAVGLLAPVAYMEDVFLPFFDDTHLEQGQEAGWMDWMGWEVGNRFLRSLGDIDPLRAFSDVCCPAIVVHGDADAEVPPENGEAFERMGARAVRIRGGDHLFSSVARKTEAFGAICAWLSGVMPAPKENGG